jgi:hypothetical protein
MSAAGTIPYSDARLNAEWDAFPGDSHPQFEEYFARLLDAFSNTKAAHVFGLALSDNEIYASEDEHKYNGMDEVDPIQAIKENVIPQLKENRFKVFMPTNKQRHLFDNIERRLIFYRVLLAMKHENYTESEIAAAIEGLEEGKKTESQNIFVAFGPERSAGKLVKKVVPLSTFLEYFTTRKGTVLGLRKRDAFKLDIMGDPHIAVLFGTNGEITNQAFKLLKETLLHVLLDIKNLEFSGHGLTRERRDAMNAAGFNAAFAGANAVGGARRRRRATRRRRAHHRRRRHTSRR